MEACLLFARIHINSKAPVVICSFVCLNWLVGMKPSCSLLSYHCTSSHFVALCSALLFLTCVLSRSLCVCVCVNVRFVFPAGPLVQPGQEEREENLVRPATDSVATQSIIQSALGFRSIRFLHLTNPLALSAPGEPMKSLWRKLDLSPNSISYYNCTARFWGFPQDFCSIAVHY